MAITPRTIISEPAAAAVAAVALFGFTVVGTTFHDAFDTPQTYYDASGPCDRVAEHLGDDTSDWSERAWVTYATCFEDRNAAREAVNVATRGLQHHPRSEALWNIKGYHQIVLEEYDAAVETLDSGLLHVRTPRTGVMENNLAWAGLWTGEMPVTRMRALYQSALKKERNACELLHTGLMVEFQAANEATNRAVAQATALRNFQNLKNRYRNCTSRVQDGRWITMTEVVGAAVLYDEVDRMLGDYDGTTNETMEKTARKLREHYKGASITALCREAMPWTGFVPSCVDSVDRAVQQQRRAERGESTRKRVPCLMRFR